jgi:hypothetical protein
MIEFAVTRVRPGHEQQLRDWFAALSGPRRAEAEQTLREEGVDHERAALVPTSDGLLLVYALSAEEPARARDVAAASTHPVDRDHHRVMAEAVLPGRLDEPVLDLRPAAEAS